jgi:2',3'-cyclic-nucleotide 2'-phosphodiesterase (5'-nucleotidase family)
MQLVSLTTALLVALACASGQGGSEGERVDDADGPPTAERGDTGGGGGVPDTTGATTRPSSACESAAAAGGDSLVHLTFLSTNDLHGALEGKIHPWSESRLVGGATALAGHIRRERLENPAGTVLLDAGDIMQGTPISNLVKGESVIAFYNAVRYDAAAIGNHEFDWGIETLKRRMAQAKFPVLAANTLSAKDGRRPEWARPTAVIERKGLKIGLIGVTTVSTPFVTLPQHVADFTFPDISKTVNAFVPELERAGAKVIVVIAHAGGFFEPDSNRYRGEIVEAMNRMAPAVDLVVSGHTHSLLDGEVRGIPLVQARSSGTALGVSELWVNAASGKVACWDIEVKTTFADQVPEEPRIAALVERYSDKIAAIAERVIAHAAHRLTADRKAESVLGDLITDAQRAAVGAEIALMNSGGIRAEIDSGAVSWRQAFEVQPFANILYRMELDGRTLRAALEHGVSGNHGLLQVAGVRFEVNPLAPVGRRVSNVRLEEGTPVRPDRRYSVAVNNFMAQGGDEYNMLRDASRVTNTGIVDLDAFVEHLERLPQPVHYRVKGRILFRDSLGATPEHPSADAGSPRAP